MKNPILITGAAGFIGANLARYFVSKGVRINIIIKKNSNLWRIKDVIDKMNVYYAELNDVNKLRIIIKKIKPKTIFHLSAHGAYSDQNNLNTITVFL